jgi:hypothetical protein
MSAVIASFVSLGAAAIAWYWAAQARRAARRGR